MTKIGAIRRIETDVLCFEVNYFGYHIGSLAPKKAKKKSHFDYDLNWPKRLKFGELGLRTSKRDGKKFLAGYFMDHDNNKIDIVALPKKSSDEDRKVEYFVYLSNKK
jgi:hypothetical protein